MRQSAQARREPETEGAAEAVRIDWVQPPGLLALSLSNFLLRVATLGIYHFWAKTEVRQRLWTAIRLQDEPLEYTGTGRELLIGFLLVFAAVLLPLLVSGYLIALWLGPLSPWLVGYQVVAYLAVALLIGVGTYRAQRYRLARTRWRGIRMALAGSSWRYGWTHFWTLLPLAVSLGWAAPWRATRLQSLITNQMRFGDQPFQFSAGAGPLYAPFAVLWLGTVSVVVVATALIAPLSAQVGLVAITSGQVAIDSLGLLKLLGLLYAGFVAGLLAYSIFSAYYRAAQINHFAGHTTLAGASFRARTTGGGLIRLAIGNFLIWSIGIAGALLAFAVVGAAIMPAIGSLSLLAQQGLVWVLALVLITVSGLLGPIIQARTTRYIVERLEIDGVVPLTRIAQGDTHAIRRGEGLAEAFDIDAF